MTTVGSMTTPTPTTGYRFTVELDCPNLRALNDLVGYLGRINSAVNTGIGLSVRSVKPLEPGDEHPPVDPSGRRAPVTMADVHPAALGGSSDVRRYVGPPLLTSWLGGRR